MSGRVDEVDEVVKALAIFGEALELLLLDLIVQRDACMQCIGLSGSAKSMTAKQQQCW